MIKKGTTVTLTIDEQIHADFVGKKRQENNEQKNTYNQRVNTDRDDEELNVQGSRGEFAFCKLFNLFPDMNINTRTMKEDNGDALLDGKVVDVKTGKRDWGGLLIPLKHRNKTSIYAYALMTGEDDTYTFRGFYLGKDAYDDKFIKNLGYGDTFVIPQKELREQYEIFNELYIISKKKYEDTNSSN